MVFSQPSRVTSSGWPEAKVTRSSLNVDQPVQAASPWRLKEGVASQVKPAEAPAKVIVNARTGTVVINGNVHITPAAVSHGKLTVSIKEAPKVVQPGPLSKGQTAVEQASSITVEEEHDPMFLFKGGAALVDIVKAVNAVGASSSDLVEILEALKQAGAMKAELVII